MTIEVKVRDLTPPMPEGIYTNHTISIDQETISSLRSAVQQGRPIPSDELTTAVRCCKLDPSQLEEIKSLRDVVSDGAAYWTDFRSDSVVQGYKDVATALHGLVIEIESPLSTFFFSSKIV